MWSPSVVGAVNDFHVKLVKLKASSSGTRTRWRGDDLVSFTSSDTSLWSGVMRAQFQYWLTSRAWVRGGLGAGSLQRDFTLGTDADYLTLTLDRGYAFAFLAGAGVDIYRKSNFAIGAEFHLSAFSLDGVGVYAPSLEVGLNWY